VESGAKVAREMGVEARTRIEQGDPADTILMVADLEAADLIVVGNRGMTGPTRFLLGSVPNVISHHAPCDVLIVKTYP
jgi:nucleotide-binding universal stress UspA family protein